MEPVQLRTGNGASLMIRLILIARACRTVDSLAPLVPGSDIGQLHPPPAVM
jgi:hypothetical protein